MAAEGRDQAGFAEFVAVLVESFGDAIGVESKRVPGADGTFAGFALPFFENAEHGGRGIEAVDGIVAAQNECGQMAAIDVAEMAARDVVIGVKESGKRAIRSVLAEKVIDGLKQTLWLIQRDRALVADIGLQIGHQKSRRDAFAGNVADDQPEAIGAEIDKVVVVAADSPRGKTVPSVIERREWRTKLRKKTALDFGGDFELLRGAAFGFEFRGGGSALGFKGVRDLVEAHESEGVAVDIAEASDDAAQTVVSAPRMGESA